MAYQCVRQNKECDACGTCGERMQVYICSLCEEPICEGDVYYGLFGERVCERCVREAREEADRHRREKDY